MTLDDWMSRVVADFPRPLQQHLRSEYRAHYQDHLAAGGSDDALALFGDPAQTRKQLQKLYVTQASLEIRPGAVPFLAVMYALIYSYFAFNFFRFPQYVNPWSTPGLVITPIGAAWLWTHTQGWAPERQKYFRFTGLATLYCTFQGFYMLPSPSDGPIFQQWQPWVNLAIVLFCVYTMRLTDARVRRTLDPTGRHNT